MVFRARSERSFRWAGGMAASQAADIRYPHGYMISGGLEDVRAMNERLALEDETDGSGQARARAHLEAKEHAANVAHHCQD